MLQVSLKRQLRNMSEVASGECQCVCVCVTDCQCYTSHCTTLYEDIQKAKTKSHAMLVGARWCNEMQRRSTSKKKTRQWPWNLQHLATPTICVTKQPKLLQHKDKLHQQQHFAWWAQIQSEGLCWSSDLKIHPWVKDTVMIMMIIMIHIVFQSALIYLSSFAWCTLIPLIFGDYDVSPYIKTQYHLIWSLPVWWCLSPFLLINPRCQGNMWDKSTIWRITPIKNPTWPVKRWSALPYHIHLKQWSMMYIYIHVCMQGNGNIC